MCTFAGYKIHMCNSTDITDSYADQHTIAVLVLIHTRHHVGT